MSSDTKRDAILTSVTIARDAFGDPRFAYLAELCGFVDADHALIKMAKLWSVCTALETIAPPIARIIVCLGAKGPDALIAADLGERTEDPDRIRMKGCERFAWYQQLHHTNGGKARAAGAQRSGGRFLPASGSPAATSAGPAATSSAPADHQREPSDHQQGPAQDQDQDQDPPRTISIVPATARREPRSRTLQDTPSLLSELPEGWKPADTPKVRTAERRAAEEYGVVVAYAFEKFVARMGSEVRLSRNWDAEWCLWLATEFPTPEQIREVRGRATTAASARASRDRQRDYLAEMERRAEPEEAARVLAEFLKPTEKAG